MPHVCATAPRCVDAPLCRSRMDAPSGSGHPNTPHRRCRPRSALMGDWPARTPAGPPPGPNTRRSTVTCCPEWESSGSEKASLVVTVPVDRWRTPEGLRLRPGVLECLAGPGAGLVDLVGVTPDGLA